MTPSIYLVDTELGVVVDGVFTATNQEIKAFGGEKSLFDFFSSVVDSQFEEKEYRIKGIRKYVFEGTVEEFNLEFVDGQPKLVPVTASEGEVVIP